MIDISIDTRFIEKLLIQHEKFLREEYNLKSVRVVAPEIKADYIGDLGLTDIKIPIKIIPESKETALLLHLRVSAGVFTQVASERAAAAISKATGIPHNGGTLIIDLKKYGVAGFNLLFTDEHLSIRCRMET